MSSARSFFCFLSLVWLVFSCHDRPDTTKSSGYFHLKSLLSAQLDRLYLTQPLLIKKVTLDGETQKTTLRPDSASWSRELDVFLAGSINKPSLVGAFGIKSEQGHTLYSRKNPEENGVKEFELFLYGNTTIPKTIRIRLSTENLLYTSSRNLYLHFNNVNGEAFLTSYSIKGSQQILSRPSTQYQLEGKVIY